MTLIVNPRYFASKAKLKAHLDSDAAALTEPSVMGTWTKNPSQLPVGFRELVTNHPQRTKFATIQKTESGWKVK